MVALNTLLQNRYLVKGQLSKGGMGAVYLVKHQRLGKTFALKETFFSDDGQLRKAFEREAQLLANLDHAALPKVTDHFTEGGNQYLVMEYIPGEDLGAQLMADGKPFPPEQVLEWAGCCAAVRGTTLQTAPVPPTAAGARRTLTTPARLPCGSGCADIASSGFDPRGFRYLRSQTLCK